MTPSRRLFRKVVWHVCVIAGGGSALISAAALRGQDPGSFAPADLKAVAQGHDVFVANCSACHGADGSGGRGNAPNLLVSPVLRANRAGGGLFTETIRQGRLSKGMPPFPTLTDPEIKSIAVFLNASSSTLGARGVPPDTLVGDASAGKRYFEGAGGCTACHSLATDLKGIGSKYNPVVLQGRILLPRANGAFPVFLVNGQADGPYTLLGPRGETGAVPVDPPRTVTVDLPSGPVTGEPIYVSDFNVALRTAAGDYRSFARAKGLPKVTINEPSEGHVKFLKTMSDKDRHDVTAYLEGLK